LDGVFGDADRTFLSGLVLTASPVVAWSFLRPDAIFYLMLFGMLCSVGSLVLARSWACPLRRNA
jgi:hypothetical protein